MCIRDRRRPWSLPAIRTCTMSAPRQGQALFPAGFHLFRRCFRLLRPRCPCWNPCSCRWRRRPGLPAGASIPTAAPVGCPVPAPPLSLIHIYFRMLFAGNVNQMRPTASGNLLEKQRRAADAGSRLCRKQVRQQADEVVHVANLLENTAASVAPVSCLLYTSNCENETSYVVRCPVS